MRNLLISLSLLVLLAACGGPSEAQIKEAKDMEAQVMEVHDVVMPYMMNLDELRSQLELHVRELESAETVDDAAVVAAKNVLERVNTADQGMRTWMKDWHENAEKLAADADHTEKMAYLNSEMSRVEEVRDDIMTSMEMAQVLMEKVAVEKANPEAGDKE